MKIKRIRTYAVTFYLVLHCLGAGAFQGSLSRNFTYPGDPLIKAAGYTITLDRNWHPKSAGSPTFFDMQGDHFSVDCLLNPDHSLIDSANSLFLTAKTAAAHGKRVTFTPLHLGKYSGGIVVHQIKHVQLPVFPPYMITLILMSKNTYIEARVTYLHAPTSMELQVLEHMAASIHVKQSATSAAPTPASSTPPILLSLVSIRR